MDSYPLWGGSSENHLMNSPFDDCEVELYYALNHSIAIVMVVYVEIDLMELPT